MSYQKLGSLFCVSLCKTLFHYLYYPPYSLDSQHNHKYIFILVLELLLYKKNAPAFEYQTIVSVNAEAKFIFNLEVDDVTWIVILHHLFLRLVAMTSESNQIP